jgi:PP-loop superfamily ATP-utilizing enzyme
MVITEELLDRTERAEKDIRLLGFRDIRVRTVDEDTCCLEVLPSQQDLLEENRSEVERALLRHFDEVTYGVRKTE